MTKVAIIYYSFTGHGTAMAKRLAQTAEKLGAEVRIRPVADDTPADNIAAIPPAAANAAEIADLPKATPEDIEWADVVIFGSPTRYSSVTHQFQAFIDTLGPLWGAGKLADKVYTAYTSSQTKHGGQETTIGVINTMVSHFGGILVTPGYTDPAKFGDGNPYGTSHITGPTNSDELSEETLTALDIQITRAITISRKLGA